MLHLKFALNLENLADEMIEKISNHWYNPFKSPTIIFPDNKLEQWFRLRWIQKKGVLANLKTLRIEEFLFEILTENKESRKKLSSEMLSQVVVAYLLTKDANGKYNYETIDETIQEYFKLNDNIDYKKIFDFSATIARLFFEYEISRPANFIAKDKPDEANPGILDCWKENELKDFFTKKDGSSAPTNDNEKWQRELYSKIFHNSNGEDSLLTKVFKKIQQNTPNNNGNNSEVKYLTLPYLYREWKNSSKNAEFKNHTDLPVFILGLSGMGQFYRVILQEFASKHDVFAYIQNPCMEFWEDLEIGKRKYKLSIESYSEKENFNNENRLMRFWGKAGRDNIKLWNIADDYSTADFEKKEKEEFELLDSKDNYSLDNSKSLLHKIQCLVANRKSGIDIKKQDFSKDTSLTITGAPNKFREIENLHSKICQLLKEGTKTSDILVVSPILNEYQSAIQLIFGKPKNIDGFHIPFNIIDSETQESLVGKIIDILFKIKEQNCISRPLFFELLRNPIVQRTRNISDDDVDSFENWVQKLNIYSQEQYGVSDWVVGIRRMLLAKLCSSVVVHENIDNDNTSLEYGPYVDFDTSNDSLLLSFINVIEDLEEWIHVKEDGISSDENENINILWFENFLDSFALMRYHEEEFARELSVYKSVRQNIKSLNNFFYAGLNEIPWDIVKLYLYNEASLQDFNYGNLFANGITFMKFAPNRTIPVKHLFFLGANADNFPGEFSLHSLDLRKDYPPWPGDDSNTDKNRYAFFCQLMSTSESFHISYQNMNLQKDEELFPSSIVNDLISFMSEFSEKPFEIKKIPIEETRNNSELFSKSSQRNKENAQKLRTINKEEGNSNKEKIKNDSQKKEETLFNSDNVSITNLRDFLCEPFSFSAKKLFEFHNSEESPTKIEFEPLFPNNLTKSIIKKELKTIFLGVNQNYQDVESYLKEVELKKLQGFLGEAEIKNLKEKIADTISYFKIKYSQNEYEYKSVDINLPLNDFDNNFSFTLSGNIPLVLFPKNEQKAIIVKFDYEDDSKKEPKTKYVIESYLQALALASEYSIDEISMLFIKKDTQVKKKDTQATLFNVEYEFDKEDISQENAKKKLLEIYKEAYTKKEQNILPINLLEKNIKNPDDLIEELIKDYGGEWKYFEGKDFFNLRELIDKMYSEENFSKKWEKAKEEHKKIISQKIYNDLLQKILKVKK